MTDWVTWNLGRATAATTQPGQTPAYGLVFDLATGRWTNQAQFNNFTADTAAVEQEPVITEGEAVRQRTLREQELVRAQNFEQRGTFTDEEDDSWWERGVARIGGVAATAAADAGNLSRHIPIVGAYLGAAGIGVNDDDELPEDPYEDYHRAGGLLTSEEFGQFSPQTQMYLIDRARASKNLTDVASKPGISHALTGLVYGYRGAGTFFNMAEDDRHQNANNFGQSLDFWFNPGKWNDAWRESETRSFGESVLRTVLAGDVSEQQLDEWSKHNSLFQMSSFGVELVGLWKFDPTVFAARGVGNAARVVRNEMPLKIDGKLHATISQRLQDEQVTARNPLTRMWGDFRAGRINKAMDQAAAYARAVDFPEFNRNMFRDGRSTDGAPAAYALWYAARHTDLNPDLLDLTKRAIFNDPKAIAKLDALKRETPEALRKYAPGSQTVIDALDAHRRLSKQFDQEAIDLTKVLDADDSAGTLRPFHRWELDTDLTIKQAQLEEVDNVLKKYDGYGAFLESLGTKAGDTALPMIAAVKTPPKHRWNSQEPVGGVRHRLFMDNQYGAAHRVYDIPEAVWTKKASTVDIHNVDTGVTAIERMFEQYDHIAGYVNDEARDAAIAAYVRAPTAFERTKILFALEEEHAVAAVSQRLGIQNPELVREVYKKMVDEQNRTLGAMLGTSNAGTVYSAGPGLAKRLANKDDLSVSLVEWDEAGDYAQIQFMNNRMEKVTVSLPKQALVPKVRPIDPTQTPNYYNPLDFRRFHLELKRNQQLLAEADRNFLFDKQASVMSLVDSAGTVFNNLWKPMQLWRLGWPQRVMMDEGLRSLAVLGSLGAQNLASGAVTASLNLDRYVARRFANRRRKGKFDFGPSPLSTSTKVTTPALRQEQLAKAPQVPERVLPKINMERRTKIADTAAEYAVWRRDALLRRAWERETGKRPDLPYTAAPKHPLDGLIKDWQGGAIKATPGVYDPVTGRRINHGYVVPVAIPEAHFDLADTSKVARGEFHYDNLRFWYEENADLLSRKGMRVVVSPDGGVTIGRWIPDGSEGTARQFTEFMHQSMPGIKMWSLRDGKTWTIEDKFDPEVLRVLDEAYDTNRRIDADAAASGALREQEDLDFGDDLDAAFNDFDLEIDRPRDLFMKAIQPKKFGVGPVTAISSDGERITHNSAFDSHEGELFKGLTSSDKTVDILSEGHGRALSYLRKRASGQVVIHPPQFTPNTLKRRTKERKEAVAYFQRWADLVNDQIAHSPIWGKMLEGWSDTKIVNWLDETPQGAAARREVFEEFDVSEAVVWEHRDLLNQYLPSKELQRRLAKGRLTPSDLRRKVADEDLPDIFGPDMDLGYLNRRQAAARGVSNFADKVWTSLGTVPIDNLVRHPFAKSMYDLKMRSLIASTDSKWLDEATIARYQDQARRFAMQQVKRTLWDLTDQTNFTDAVRFIAPFWGAQQEAIVKWLRIISDRPETVARFFIGQRAVYNNFMVVDREGNEHGTGVREGGLHNLGLYNPEDRVIISIPKSLRDGALGKALTTFGDVGVPIGSANTVLQGELPLMPGLGPLVTIPADKFFRAVSDSYGTTNDEDFWYRWLFPVGRPSPGVRGSLESLFPGWGRRLLTATADEDDNLKANILMGAARELELVHQKKGLPPPTAEQVQAHARWIYGLRMIVGLVAPVQMEFRGKNQFFIDEAHKYRQEHGMEWWDKFIDDFGEAAATFAVSSSEGFIPPTSQAMEEWSGIKPLVSDFPDWASAMISQDAYADDFSYDAYRAQFDINLAPGDTRELRSIESIPERFRERDVQLGWREYRQFMSMVTAELSARGLTSLRQGDAQDLSLLREAFLKDLKGRNNNWGKEYDDYSDNIYARVHELEQWAFDKRFDGRADIEGVRTYLAQRDKVTEELDRYHVETGGSRSLQAEENEALRMWWEGWVGELVQANPAFGEFYFRYLESDTMERGGGDW